MKPLFQPNAKVLKSYMQDSNLVVTLGVEADNFDVRIEQTGRVLKRNSVKSGGRSLKLFTEDKEIDLGGFGLAGCVPQSDTVLNINFSVLHGAKETINLRSSLGLDDDGIKSCIEDGRYASILDYIRVTFFTPDTLVTISDREPDSFDLVVAEAKVESGEVTAEVAE